MEKFEELVMAELHEMERVYDSSYESLTSAHDALNMGIKFPASKGGVKEVARQIWHEQIFPCLGEFDPFK